MPLLPNPTLGNLAIVPSHWGGEAQPSVVESHGSANVRSSTDTEAMKMQRAQLDIIEKKYRPEWKLYSAAAVDFREKEVRSRCTLWPAHQNFHLFVALARECGCPGSMCAHASNPCGQPLTTVFAAGRRPSFDA